MPSPAPPANPTASRASTSFRCAPSQTAAATSSRASGAAGSRACATWCRGTCRSPRRASCGGCTTTSSRPTSGSFRRGGSARRSTICGAPPRRAAQTRSSSSGEANPVRRLHPEGRGARFLRDGRLVHDLPGRRVLRQQRRARRALGRSGAGHRLGRREFRSSPIATGKTRCWPTSRPPCFPRSRARRCPAAGVTWLRGRVRSTRSVACFERFERAGVGPPARQHVEGQVAARDVGVVDVGDLQLAAARTA